MKSSWLQLRADPDDLDRLKRAAKRKHMTVSAFVWWCVWEMITKGERK